MLDALTRAARPGPHDASRRATLAAAAGARRRLPGGAARRWRGRTRRELLRRPGSLLVLLVVAVLPGVRARAAGPHGRRRAGRSAGWLLDTTWYGRPGRAVAGARPGRRCSTWAHTLTALAAVLPYDAIVAPGRGDPLAGPGLAVVLTSAVLTVRGAVG